MPITPLVKQKSYIQASLMSDIAILLVAVFWGSSFIVAKNALLLYPLFLFLFMRFSISALLMLPLCWKQLRAATADTWKIGGIFGFFLFFIFSLETMGVAHTSATNAGFIISICVVLVPLLESISKRKFPRLPIIAAALLMVIGTGLLTLKKELTFHVGDLLILLAAFVRAFFMIYSQRSTSGKEVDSSVLTFIQLSVVAICTGIIAFQLYPIEAMVPQQQEIWWALIYLAVFCTIYAFFVQLTVIRRTSPTRVGLLLGTEPLFAVFFGIVIGGEVLTVQGWLGGGCILIATILGRQGEKYS